VRCADIEDPANYDGYQIALWRKIAEDLGWADSDWTFSCVDWTAMIDDLTAADGLCSFAAAGGCRYQRQVFLEWGPVTAVEMGGYG
jgi:ABC-type amino acid transport substrate-binding protein